MRKREREITDRAEIDRIIRSCRVCHLSLASADEPYGLPISFGYDGRALFFHTARGGRKLDFIAANPRAAFHFAGEVRLIDDPRDSCQWTFAYASVAGSGILTELTDEPDKIAGLNRIMLQYSGRQWDFDPGILAVTRIWRLEVERISGKRSPGEDVRQAATERVLASRGGFVIRDLRPQDAPAIARHADNSKIANQLRDGFPHPYTQADAEAFLAMALAQEPRGIFAIAAADEAIGCIGLMPGLDVHRLTAEMGYWLAEPFWGRGLATWAIEVVAEHGFREWGLRRIHADPYTNNPASARALEKAGFVREGVLRASVVKHGQILDQFLYARIRDHGGGRP